VLLSIILDVLFLFAGQTTMIKDPATDESDAFWGVNFKHGSSLKASEYHDRYVHCIMNLE